ncbi:hypothetical protein BN1723_006745, partial [Verticillium longisporum]
MKLNNVVIPFEHDNAAWDITVTDGVVESKIPAADASGPSSLLLPTLCHPHIHLDKTYLLTCNRVASSDHPGYSDLAPTSGTFEEALANTSKAKSRYTEADLYFRGSQLLATSYKQGITSLRAFVEVDHVTGVAPLVTAVRLKKDFRHLINVQICIFAQDPLFSTAHGKTNREALEAALGEYIDSIDALGTTPYVEDNDDASGRNIAWAVATALQRDLHLDIHIEYNLGHPGSVDIGHIQTAIECLEGYAWATKANCKTVVLGHATRLTEVPRERLQQLADRIHTSELPVYFVGLPSSDLYMMGRPAGHDDASQDFHQRRPRGTLNVPSLIKDYQINACLSVNNVGNAFTPYGTGDPLALASLGVGLYHAGSVDDARLLYECVSTGAEAAIGLGRHQTDEGNRAGTVEQGKDWRPLLLIAPEADLELPSSLTTNDAPQRSMTIPSRHRLGIKDVVWDPPETTLRSII